MWTALLILIIAGVILVKKTFIVVEMREEVILERLGKYIETLKPGFHFLIPFIDKAAYQQEMREQVIDIPPQSCITKDNIEVAVDGLVYLKVMDAYKASYGIENYRQAAINLAQTTMRSEIGKITLDDTFSERELMNENIVREIDKASDPWGIKVLRYEIKNIRPSEELIHTLEKQMEAERAKRADIVSSSGERDARINEAEGKSKEMKLIANSTANGLKQISEAIGKPGGQLAVKTRLMEQFIDELGTILDQTNVSVLPVETANLKSFFEGMGKVHDHTQTGASNAPFSGEGSSGSSASANA